MIIYKNAEGRIVAIEGDDGQLIIPETSPLKQAQSPAKPRKAKRDRSKTDAKEADDEDARA